MSTGSCDGSCAGNELMDCSHAEDEKMAEERLQEMRLVPEYVAMFNNLSATQARCGVLLLALRDVKRVLKDCEPEVGLGPDTVVGLLVRVERALNPPLP